MCVSDGFEDTVYQKWKAGRAQVCRVLQHVCLSFPFFKASTLYRLGLKEGISRGLVVVIQVVHPLCYCLEYPPEQKQCTSHHVGSGQGELSSIYFVDYYWLFYSVHRMLLPPPKVPSFLHGHLLPSDSSVCVPPSSFFSRAFQVVVCLLSLRVSYGSPSLRLGFELVLLRTGITSLISSFLDRLCQCIAFRVILALRFEYVLLLPSAGFLSLLSASFFGVVSSPPASFPSLPSLHVG